MATKAYSVQVNVTGDSSKGQKAMTGLAAEAESSSGRLKKAFSSVLGTLNSTGILGPFGESLSMVSDGLDEVSEKGKSVGTAMMATGGVVTGVGAMLSGLGSSEAKAQAGLKQAVENTGASYGDYSKQVDGAVSHQEKFGDSAVETKTALATLVEASGSTTKALGDMNVVTELAAATHTSLTSAATQWAKVYSGSVPKALKQLGIDTTAASAALKAVATDQKAVTSTGKALDAAQQAQGNTQTKVSMGLLKGNAASLALANAQAKVDTTTGNFTVAQQNLAKAQAASASGANVNALATQVLAKTHGIAEAQANTFGGRIDALKTKFEDQAAELGAKYGPAITAVGAGMSITGGIVDGVSAILGRSGKAAEAAGDAAGEAAGGVDLLTGATDAEALSMDDAAVSEGLALGPILLIIAAVALLGVGIYELVTHWKAVWSAIKDAVGDVLTWVKGHWPLLLAILTGPVGLAILFVKDHFKEITGAISDAIGWVKDHWPLLLAILTGPVGLAVLFIKDHFNQIVQFIEGLPGKIEKVASHLWDSMLTAAKNIGGDILNFFSQLPGEILGFFGHLGSDLLHSITSSLPGGGVIGSALGAIGLATGGIVTQPTLAVVGESGPEAVVPLSGGVQILGASGSGVSSLSVTQVPSGGGRGSGSYSGGSGGGDLVIQMNDRELARIAGPAFVAWMANHQGRNGVKGKLSGVNG